jgi:hypothetical protein
VGEDEAEPESEDEDEDEEDQDDDEVQLSRDCNVSNRTCVTAALRPTTYHDTHLLQSPMQPPMSRHVCRDLRESLP